MPERCAGSFTHDVWSNEVRIYLKIYLRWYNYSLALFSCSMQNRDDLLFFLSSWATFTFYYISMTVKMLMLAWGVNNFHLQSYLVRYFHSCCCSEKCGICMKYVDGHYYTVLPKFPDVKNMVRGRSGRSNFVLVSIFLHCAIMLSIAQFAVTF